VTIEATSTITDAAARAADHTADVHWGSLLRAVTAATRAEHVALTFARRSRTVALINAFTDAMIILTAEPQGVRLEEDFRGCRAPWPGPDTHMAAEVAVERAHRLSAAREPEPHAYCLTTWHTAGRAVPGCDHNWVTVSTDGQVHDKDAK
jgi:hypothetical protein